MNTRQLLPLLSAAVLLCAGSACHKAIRTSSLIVHPNLAPIFGVSSGGTAKWVVANYHDNPFVIHFFYPTPCENNGNDLLAQPPKDASCKIPKDSDGVYKYEIQMKDTHRSLGGGPIYMHVDGCKGCPTVFHRNHPFVAPPPVKPGDPEPVYLDCDPGKAAYADPVEIKVYPGQTLQWAPVGKETITWEVKGIPPDVCDGGTFNNKNSYCVVKATAIPTTKPGNYSITRGGCAPGTANLTILPPSAN